MTIEIIQNQNELYLPSIFTHTRNSLWYNLQMYNFRCYVPMYSYGIQSYESLIVQAEYSLH